MIKTTLNSGLVSIVMDDEEFGQLCSELSWIRYEDLAKVEKDKSLPYLCKNDLTKPIFRWLNVDASAISVMSIRHGFDQDQPNNV